MSSIPHAAAFANVALPLPNVGEGIGENGEGIGEGIGPHREPIGETLARISERLAVVAVSAHIMERRAPRDVYARSIARETHALAVELREAIRQAQAGAPMRAPRIVEAAPDTDTAPDGDTGDTRPGELCPFPGCCHWYNDPCADCLTVEQGASPSSETPTPRERPGSSRRSTTQKRRQTPPAARQRATGAQASDSAARTYASPTPSRASSGASGGASGAPRRAGGAQ